METRTGIHRRKAAARVSLFAVTALVLGPGGLGAQDQTPVLSGTWKFDPARSAEEKKVETGRDPVSGRGMNRDRNVGARSVPGTSSQAPTELGAMGRFVRPHPQMVIVHSDSSVTITLPTGISEAYQLDGRKERLEVPGSEPIETSARWRGGKLTVEKKYGKLGSVREIYSLRAEGKELMIEVRITGEEIVTPIDQKRIYDRVSGGS